MIGPEKASRYVEREGFKMEVVQNGSKHCVEAEEEGCFAGESISWDYIDRLADWVQVIGVDCGFVIMREVEGGARNIRAWHLGEFVLGFHAVPPGESCEMLSSSICICLGFGCFEFS